MSRIKFVFVILLLVNVLSVSAQRNYQDYNKIGLSAGYLMANIETDDLVLSAGDGFMFGFETRGSFSRNIDFIFGLTYYDATMELETSLASGALQNSSNIELTPMKLSSVQLQFLGSLNIVRHHLSIEVGPAVAIQGKFKPSSDAEEARFVGGFNALTVGDLRETSTVDFRGVAGLSAGFEPFRLSVMYIRGFTNTLNSLREANTESANFSGNTSYVVLRGIVYF